MFCFFVKFKVLVWGGFWIKRLLEIVSGERLFKNKKKKVRFLDIFD